MRGYMQVTVLMVGVVAGASTAWADDGFRFLPVLDRNFRSDPRVAVITGGAFTRSGRTLATAGLELDVNCGLFQTPGDAIRTHISVESVTGAGVQAQLVQLSPRYTVPVFKALFVNAGPVVGLLRARVKPGDDGKYAALFGYGAAGGIEYRAGHAFAGVTASYLETTSDRGTRLPLTSVLVVAGYDF